jgi:NTP pyrophosphatase (non-canonical NTP hydrolase)
MTLNEMAKKAHQMSKDKGWYKGRKRQPLEFHMLMVTEIAEASESVRNKEYPIWIREGGKPEGEAIELADAVIRIGDYFAKNGWDLEKVVKMKMKYNATRPHRHGGKAL